MFYKLLFWGNEKTNFPKNRLNRKNKIMQTAYKIPDFNIPNLFDTTGKNKSSDKKLAEIVKKLRSINNHQYVYNLLNEIFNLSSFFASQIR